MQQEHLLGGLVVFNRTKGAKDAKGTTSDVLQATSVGLLPTNAQNRSLLFWHRSRLVGFGSEMEVTLAEPEEVVLVCEDERHLRSRTSIKG